jgi:hypothetical protein
VTFRAKHESLYGPRSRTVVVSLRCIRRAREACLRGRRLESSEAHEVDGLKSARAVAKGPLRWALNVEGSGPVPAVRPGTSVCTARAARRSISKGSGAARFQMVLSAERLAEHELMFSIEPLASKLCLSAQEAVGGG